MLHVACSLGSAVSADTPHVELTTSARPKVVGRCAKCDGLSLKTAMVTLVEVMCPKCSLLSLEFTTMYALLGPNGMLRDGPHLHGGKQCVMIAAVILYRSFKVGCALCAVATEHHSDLWTSPGLSARLLLQTGGVSSLARGQDLRVRRQESEQNSTIG